MQSLLTALARVGLLATVIGGLVLFGMLLGGITTSPGEPVSPLRPAASVAGETSGQAAARLQASVDDLRQRAALYEAQLNAYKTQVDTLQRLVTIVISMASLYAIILGISSYLTAQPLVEKIRKQSDEVDELQAKIEKQSPLLAGLGQALERIRDRLNELLPNSVERMKYYQDLEEPVKQEIMLLERLAGIYAESDRPASVIADTFRGLGKFYNARFLVQVPAAARATVNETQRDDLHRAYLYFTKAAKKDPSNFMAWNDLGLLLEDLMSLPDPPRWSMERTAEECYQKSILLEPRQQRAYYNLAGWYARRDDYRKAETLLTEALKHRKWQRDHDKGRVEDIHYNRACYRSRRAEEEAAAAPGLAKLALADVEAACYEDMPQETAAAFLSDIKTGQDLAWLHAAKPQEMGKIEVWALARV